MTSNAEQAVAWVETLHDAATQLFETLDEGGQFLEDAWERPGGGGGVTRLLTDGATFEKIGVNKSAVSGHLTAALAERLGSEATRGADAQFFATGLSIVAHPRHPRLPTVHLNVRYFEISRVDGLVLDAWFGGGTDLTPTYPQSADAIHFHSALRRACDAHHAALYAEFKPQCDEYFRNHHRGGEARGIGGIFFDHLRPSRNKFGLETDALFAFAGDVARSLQHSYVPIIRARCTEISQPEERHLQLKRRARYVEFNLLHDRGTLFGLQSNARIESVLMSLPPLAEWTYTPAGSESELERALLDMLVPRDWAD